MSALLICYPRIIESEPRDTKCSDLKNIYGPDGQGTGSHIGVPGG